MHLKAMLVTMVSKYFEYGGIKMGRILKFLHICKLQCGLLVFKDVREGINFLD